MNWMHSCRHAAELLSQRLDEPLSLIDELKLRMLLSMCGNCANVAQQMRAVHAASAELLSGGLNFDNDAPPAGGTHHGPTPSHLHN